MNVNHLINYYGVSNQSQLAQKLEVGRSTITDWTINGIPPQIQATFEVQTNGKLKADRDALNLRFKSFRENKKQATSLSA